MFLTADLPYVVDEYPAGTDPDATFGIEPSHVHFITGPRIKVEVAEVTEREAPVACTSGLWGECRFMDGRYYEHPTWARFASIAPGGEKIWFDLDKSHVCSRSVGHDAIHAGEIRLAGAEGRRRRAGFPARGVPGPGAEGAAHRRQVL